MHYGLCALAIIIIRDWYVWWEEQNAEEIIEGEKEVYTP